MSYDDSEGAEAIVISSVKDLSLSTKEDMKLNQKKLFISTDDTVTLKTGSTTIKIDGHGAVEMAVGAVKIQINGNTAAVTISGAVSATVPGFLHADNIIANTIVSGKVTRGGADL